MSLHFSPRNRGRFPTEGELIRAEASLRSSQAGQVANCPTSSQLKTFVDGGYGQTDPAIALIMDHIDDCDACLAAIAEIRSRANREKSKFRFRRSRLFVAAAAVLVLALIFFWAIRGGTPSTAVATVDLRQVTRSGEAPLISLSSASRSIRVLLPGGSVEGKYEVGIFGPAAPLTPILSDSARSTVEDGETVVIVAISLNKVPPGPYLLGIRDSGSEWKQYAITIK